MASTAAAPSAEIAKPRGCLRTLAIGEATDGGSISTRAAAKMASAAVGSGIVSAASVISAENSPSVIISPPLGDCLKVRARGGQAVGLSQAAAVPHEAAISRCPGVCGSPSRSPSRLVRRSNEARVALGAQREATGSLGARARPDRVGQRSRQVWDRSRRPSRARLEGPACRRVGTQFVPRNSRRSRRPGRSMAAARLLLGGRLEISRGAGTPPERHRRLSRRHRGGARLCGTRACTTAAGVPRARPGSYR